MSQPDPATPRTPAALLARAVSIAADAHETQLDKADAPYILHPLRLMARAQTLSEQTVAILHDVIEDAPQEKGYTFEFLEREGFPPEIVEALRLVTKQADEEGEAGYEKFVGRILGASGEAGRIARRVKLLDLEDNMMLTRLTDLSESTLKRLQRYHRAHGLVTEAIERDNQSNKA